MTDKVPVISVSRIYEHGLWHFIPQDDAGRESWPFKLEWNRHSGYFRSERDAIKAARRCFPGAELIQGP